MTRLTEQQDKALRDLAERCYRKLSVKTQAEIEARKAA